MAAFERTEIVTADPAEARELLARTFGARLQVHTGWDSRSPVTLTAVTAGEVTLTELSLPAELSFRVDDRDPVVITAVTGGGVSVDRARSADHYRPGDVYLANYPGADALTSHAHGARTRTVILRASLLADVAVTAPGALAAPVKFSSFSPDSNGARRWSETTRFVDRLVTDPGATSAPLITGSAARLLAATALSVFPNTTATTAAGDQRDARPETVRRAVSFIEANAGRDIALVDIASAAYVTTRAVQLAFRRHLDTTPMAYLRRVRLELAYEDLSHAPPAGRVSVTAVAYRWGFLSPSRFAAQYRSTYGELPSVTLHR